MVGAEKAVLSARKVVQRLFDSAAHNVADARHDVFGAFCHVVPDPFQKDAYKGVFIKVGDIFFVSCTVILLSFFSFKRFFKEAEIAFLVMSLIKIPPKAVLFARRFKFAKAACFCPKICGARIMWTEDEVRFFVWILSAGCPRVFPQIACKSAVPALFNAASCRFRPKNYSAVRTEKVNGTSFFRSSGESSI